MASRMPSGTNTFIASFEAGAVVVSFTRDPKKFKHAGYVEYRPTKKDVSFYLKLDVDQPARVIDDSLFGWADGAEAPKGANNIGNFVFAEYRTKRRAFPFSLGMKAVEQAAWDILAQHAGIVAQQAMTLRTIRTATLLQTTSNWPSANVADVTILNGGAGKWDIASSDPASVNYLGIKKAILRAAELIALATNAAVDWHDMSLVMSVGCAKKVAATSEVHDYVKSPEGASMLKGDEGIFGDWGMPNTIYRMKVVVENAVKVTSNINTGGTATRAFCFSDSNPVITSKPGGLNGQYDGPSFSTVQFYFYEEMTVESKSDPDNRRNTGRVVEDYAEVLAAGAAGFSLTNAV